MEGPYLEAFLRHGVATVPTSIEFAHGPKICGPVRSGRGHSNLSDKNNFVPVGIEAYGAYGP